MYLSKTLKTIAISWSSSLAQSCCPAIVRLVGSLLLEQQEEWQLERPRFFSEATMAKIPESEELLELADGDPAEQPATING